MTGLLLRLFTGWRLIRLKGRQSERLISGVVSRGYRLWHVERQRDELWCLVTEEGYEALSSLASEFAIEIATERRGGLPFRWRQFRSRPFLAVGLASAWLLVWYMTSHIWAIQVVAPQATPATQAELIAAAARSGLRIGAGTNRLDIPQIRRTMLSSLPQYSWIGIHTRGMVAVIDAVRFVERPSNHLPARLVASSAGRVTEVYVYMGTADVGRDELVQKGQTLISGVVIDAPPIQPKGAKKPVEESVLTPAEGQVLADVTYRVHLFQPLKESRQIATGHSFVQYFLEFGRSYVMTIPLMSPMPFKHYDIQKIVRPIRFAGIELPVEVVQLVYNEKVIHTVSLSAHDAIRQGRQRALAEMEKKIPKDGKPVRQSLKVAAEKTGVWVTLTRVINHNIAAPPNAANNKKA